MMASSVISHTPSPGVVCASARAVPPAPGVLPVQVQDADGGVEVTDCFDWLTAHWLRPPAFPLPC